MSSWIEAVRSALDRLTTGQKVQIFAAALATLGVLWGMVAYATRIHYDVLYSGIDVDSAAEVIAALKQKDVSYRLTRGGKVIEVPAGKIDELRMELAGEGLPRGEGVGFEIFDKPAFGLSSFVQNVNYRRALERELGRTIQQFDSVESARVHLAMPPESVFAEDQKEASASVVVRLHGDRPLASGRVRAIAHLVASGVEELDPSRVSVIDSQGRLLSGGEGDDDTALSSTQNEAKQAMERHIESVLIAIVEPVVGRGKARARATVELETARVDRVEERYDPDGAVVRSEQRNKAKSGSSGAAGVPGADANIPQGTAAGGVGDTSSQTQASTTNFEINKTVSKIAEPRGRLLRQSVAVVVDNMMTTTEDADGNATQEAVPRSDEEMEKITALVHAAVGIDEDRGDSLIVENIPFDESLNPSAATGGGLDWVHLITEIARYLALPLAVLLVVLFAIRPGVAAVRTLRPPALPEGSPVQTIAELQAQIAKGVLPAEAVGSPLRAKLIEAATEDPRAAALVIRGWLGKNAE